MTAVQNQTTKTKVYFILEAVGQDLANHCTWSGVGK